MDLSWKLCIKDLGFGARDLGLNPGFAVEQTSGF